jgi:hypothetical protein
MILHAGYEDNPQDLEASWIRLSSHCDPVEVLPTIATRHLLEQGDFLNRDASTAAAMQCTQDTNNDEFAGPSAFQVLSC